MGNEPSGLFRIVVHTLLCDQYSSDLAALDIEIGGLYNENSLITADESFSTRELTLNSDLEIYVSTLLKNKDKEFIRDKLAFDNGQAYNWASASRSRRRPTNFNNKNKKNSKSNPNKSNPVESSTEYTDSD